MFTSLPYFPVTVYFQRSPLLLTTSSLSVVVENGERNQRPANQIAVQHHEAERDAHLKIWSFYITTAVSSCYQNSVTVEHMRRAQPPRFLHKRAERDAAKGVGLRTDPTIVGAGSCNSPRPNGVALIRRAQPPAVITDEEPNATRYEAVTPVLDVEVEVGPPVPSAFVTRWNSLFPDHGERNHQHLQ